MVNSLLSDAQQVTGAQLFTIMTMNYDTIRIDPVSSLLPTQSQHVSLLHFRFSSPGTQISQVEGKSGQVVLSILIVSLLHVDLGDERKIS